jgi:hypothetical protein
MGDKAFEYEVPTDRHSRPEISNESSEKSDIDVHVQKIVSNAPKRANTFLIKAKAWGILIGAITGGFAGIWSAVRKPDTIQAKQGYEALTKAVDKQSKDISQNHDDVLSLYAYLKAWQDLQGRAQPGPSASAAVPDQKSAPISIMVAPGLVPVRVGSGKLRPIGSIASAKPASSAMVVIPIASAELPALSPPSLLLEAPILPKFDTFK